MSRQPSQKARIRALAIVLGLPVVIAAGLGLFFWAKSVRTLERVPSPNRTWTATVRVVKWGGYSTHVSIAPTDSLVPSRRDKVFVADNDGGATTLGPAGELPLTLRWESDQRLVIYYPAKARIYRKEQKVGPVEIAYSPR